MGIHDRIKSNDYVRVNESNDSEYLEYTRTKMPDDISASISGQDFHKDLEALHRNVRPYVEDGQNVNAHDNYIHDTLKQTGIPNGKTVLHALSVMTMPGLHPYNSASLRKKWIPLFDKYSKKKLTPGTIDTTTYNADTINKIPQSLTPTNGHVLKHEETGAEFEYHPTEGYRYLGVNPKSVLTSRGYEDPVSQRGISSQLFKTYKDHTDKDGKLEEYTTDSAPVNRYLHLKHKDRIGASGSILGRSYEHLDDTANKVSEAINSTQHRQDMNDFTVYTGLHTEFNPRTHSTMTDENGHMIFHNPGFTSTSLLKHVANDFARDKSDSMFPYRKVHDMMKLTIPGGYPHGMFIKPFSEHEHEDEYLLDKGHIFTIDPNPKHYFVDGRLTREWSGKIHPKYATDIPYNKQSKIQKINTSYLPTVNPEHIEKMSNDSDTDVVSTAAKHPLLSNQHLTELSNHESPRIRKAAMLNPNLSDADITKKLDTFDLNAIRGLANRKTLSDEHKSKIINSGHIESARFDDHDISRQMAFRSDLSDEHVRQLQKTKDVHTHVNLASNPHINPDILHEYTTHPDYPVRFALSDNHMIKPETAEVLKNDKHATIGSNVLLNPVLHRQSIN